MSVERTMKPDEEAAFGCVNNTIRLRSGRYFDLADPKPDQFTFDDIAGGLSHVCRFGGQVPRFYSVAEHLINCATVAVGRGLNVQECRAALMHDAAEAFIGDCVKPLKVMLPDYQRVEARVEAAIGERYGIDFAATAAAWKPIDRAVLIAERKIMIPDQVKWTGEDEVEQVRIRVGYLHPDAARAVFESTAHWLGLATDLDPETP